jgi:enoyl-CoA hydratase
VTERERDVVLYATDGPVANLTLNRPRYRNAQSYHLLDELDAALERAMADDAIRVVTLRGAGGNFSSGHDLGTPEGVAYREELGIPDSGIGWYESFRRYNLDLTFKWRNMPKPTIAVVEGFCIFGGWMIAASMDLVFAHREALFLPALLEYASVPWDISPKKAKEICFESRFLTADEACDLGFVNRVYESVEELECETRNYALRVSENSRMGLRMTKLNINKAQDLQGYAAGMEGGFADYVVMSQQRGTGRVEGVRRLGGVDLALRGLRGERPGLSPAE